MVGTSYRSALISFRQICLTNIHLANGTKSTNHCKSEKATRVCVCGWSWCMPANRGRGPGLIGLLMACCKALLLFSLYTDIPHAFMCLGKKTKCRHYKKHHQHQHSNMPKYQTNAKKTILFSAQRPSQRVYSTKARTSFPEFFAQHK